MIGRVADVCIVGTKGKERKMKENIMDIGSCLLAVVLSVAALVAVAELSAPKVPSCCGIEM